MAQPAVIPLANPAATPPRRTFFRKLANSKFLWISLAVHLLFGAGATVLIVQRISAKRKVTFESAPPTRERAATEHKVQMVKKQQSMSAPAQPKRIAAAGAMAKIVLPEIPDLPNLSGPVVPNAMGGSGKVGNMMGTGGGGPGGGTGGGAGMNMFGLTAAGAGLQGTFYDFKRESKSRMLEKNVPSMTDTVKNFTSGNWGPKAFKNYTSATKLYAKTFYFPALQDTEAGAAFRSPETKAGNWLASYAGDFYPSEDGAYRLIGFGDNVLIVRIGGRIVLDASDHGYTGNKREELGNISFPNKPKTTLFAGPTVEFHRGQSENVQIIVGDEGGIFCAGLFIQKQGTPFKQGANGVPELPLFVIGSLTSDEQKALTSLVSPVAITGPRFTQPKGPLGTW